MGIPHGVYSFCEIESFDNIGCRKSVGGFPPRNHREIAPLETAGNSHRSENREGLDDPAQRGQAAEKGTAMKLYEVVTELEKLVESMVDPETGELLDDPEAEAKLRGMELAKAEKVIQCACYWKNLAAEAEALRTEEKHLAERRRIAERKGDWLKQYLSNYLEPGERYSDTRAALSWRRSEVVEVDDETLPTEWCRVRYEVDKVRIKAALKNGDTVPGAALIEKQNIQIK